MFRNMVTSLFKFERIKTTDAKAKELRSWAEHLITLAKRGDLHARRQALAIVREKEVVHKLFNEASEKFGSVQGGYTRVVKLGTRPGDKAPVSIIELITTEKPKKKKAAKKKDKAPAKKSGAATTRKKATAAKPKAAASSGTATEEGAGPSKTAQETDTAQPAEVQATADVPKKPKGVKAKDVQAAAEVSTSASAAPKEAPKEKGDLESKKEENE
jgi:large subunit ribosomal protein L17